MVEKTYRIIKTTTINLLAGIILAAVLVVNVFAKSSPSLISDDETQTLLAEIVKPLYKAAGVSFNQDKIYIVNDNSLNAFVKSSSV